MNVLPIRKVATGLIASGLYYGLHHFGFEFPHGAADDVAQALVGPFVAYIVPDPRVQGVVRKPGLVAKYRAFMRVVNLAVTEDTQPPAV